MVRHLYTMVNNFNFFLGGGGGEISIEQQARKKRDTKITKLCLLSKVSDVWLSLERAALEALQCPNYIVNSVNKTKCTLNSSIQIKMRT